MDLIDFGVLEEFENEWDSDTENNSEEVTFLQPTQNVINGENGPKQEHLDILSKYFGHKMFRPLQWCIINSIINDKRDNCAIMTTGYGKSLCYQFPSVYVGGITIVISPLISLMEDQILSLKVMNIPSCLLGSANIKQRDTIEQIFEDKYSLIYCTPEFVTSDTGRSLLVKMKNELSITLIAVDEAHCVSSWGHDFRFQYRELGMLKNILPEVPILAVTATATPKVKDDILKSLRLSNPQVTCSGFDRPNLYFAVYLKGNLGIFEDIRRYVMEKVDGQWKFSGSTIVYCITRKQTEDISEILNKNGINCLPYHAGLSLATRKETHMKFVRDKIDCIVATIAFGMGIDKPDVRNIIHYGASSSIEGYYQEVGRAGRDGLPGKCICFYTNGDFTKHERMSDLGYGSDRNKERKGELLRKMLDYLTTRNCRRKYILTHFEGVNAKVPYTTLCCDNCTMKKTCPDEKYEGLDDKGLYDFTTDVKLYLSTVSIMNGKFGATNYNLFLRGSKNSKMKYYENHPQHGCGKHRSEAWWKGISYMLIKEGYLKKNSVKNAQHIYYIYSISEKGDRFLSDINRNSNVKLMLVPPPELFKMLKKKPNAEMNSTLGDDRRLNNMISKPAIPQTTENDLNKEESILYRLLINKRSELANKNDCMPYMIASDALLMSAAKIKPKDSADLYSIGYATAKIEKFGESFLRIVRISCGLDPDVPKYVPDSSSIGSIQSILEMHPMEDAKYSSTAESSYFLFKAGKTVKEIAMERYQSQLALIATITDVLVPETLMLIK